MKLPVVLPVAPVVNSPSAVKHWTTIALAVPVVIKSPSSGVCVEFILIVCFPLSKDTIVPWDDVNPSVATNVPTISFTNTVLLNLTLSLTVSSFKIASPSPSFSNNIFWPGIASPVTVASSSIW